MSPTHVPTKRSPLQTGWSGLLARDNIGDVAERMRRMLDGKRYTFVSAKEGRLAPEVRVSQRLDQPLTLRTEDDLASIICSDGNYVWGVHTTAATERAARLQSEGMRTLITFSADYRGDQMTVEMLNGFGDHLHWTVMVEEES